MEGILLRDDYEAHPNYERMRQYARKYPLGMADKLFGAATRHPRLIPRILHLLTSSAHKALLVRKLLRHNPNLASAVPFTPAMLSVLLYVDRTMFDIVPLDLLGADALLVLLAKKPLLIKRVPARYITNAIVEKIVPHIPQGVLQYLPPGKITQPIAERMVQLDPAQLQYVPTALRTPKMEACAARACVKGADTYTPSEFRKLSASRQFDLVREDPFALFRMPRDCQTPALVLHAMHNNPRVFFGLADSAITYEIARCAADNGYDIATLLATNPHFQSSELLEGWALATVNQIASTALSMPSARAQIQAWIDAVHARRIGAHDAGALQGAAAAAAAAWGIDITLPPPSPRPAELDYPLSDSVDFDVDTEYESDTASLLNSSSSSSRSLVDTPLLADAFLVPRPASHPAYAPSHCPLLTGI